ncbi:PorP/SprF family type IX secretion system membrane protein [Capnocytophaga gingivalis]
MKIGLLYKIWLCFLISAFALAQEQKGYYMPYQMPTHAFVRFNTFVANPAFPLIVNYQEHNVGLYYRNQWSGYKNDNFSLMGLSYGRNWRETSSMNAMVFKRNATVMTNYGVVLNYGHLITLSDQVRIGLGLSVVPSFSGLDKGRIRAADPTDPLLNVGNSFDINVQPGGYIAFGDFYIAGMAENLIDYSSGAGKAMTEFRDKTFTAHLMYRTALESNNSLLENGYWSAAFRATKEYDGYNFGGSAMLDLPALGWLNVGYTQRNGLLAGVGVNLRQQWSLGVEYENPIGVKIPQLGSTFGVYLNVQFGGERQKVAPPPTPRNPTKRPEIVQVTPEKTEEKKPEPLVKQPDLTKVPVKPNQAPISVKIETMEGVPPGHYVIIGVYASARNAFNFRQQMAKRYEVGTFVNKKNGLNYVYLGKGNMSLEEAQALMRKQMVNIDFIGGIWVLEVKAL